MEKIKRFLWGGHAFKREFREQMRLFIVVTFGFTIAFSWRQTFFDASEALISHFIHTNTATTLSILASTFITVISLGIIYLASHYLKETY